ncbi:PREDICTED: RNA-binding protein 38-like [Camelina sativa]|uniref:RNA-binding protein 38-like n=1 Tax=Camelina sativa TaxID=90675 RepID=A0ABM0XHV7_CAMSA|nr:PREDICTED: RNA-binding protein 38-like [Camelina sativa]
MSQTNQPNKIFVGNLTWRTTSEDLKTHFEQFGEVIDANVVCETYPVRSKGYGFVTFKETESAVRALENPTPVIDERTTNCNLATRGGAKKNMNLPNQNGSLNQVRPPHQYQQPPPFCLPPVWPDTVRGCYLYSFHNPYTYSPYYNFYPTPTPTRTDMWHQPNPRHAVTFSNQRSSFRCVEVNNETDGEAVSQRSSVRIESVSETDQKIIADAAHHDNEEAVTKPDVDQQTVESMCEQRHDTKQDEDVTIELDNGIEVTHQDERVVEYVVEETP